MHPNPYPARERDYDPVAGRDIGPWDSEAADEVAVAAMDDALVDRRLITVSVSLPVDDEYEAFALSRDGRPFAIQVDRPSGMRSVVTVMAAPRGVSGWPEMVSAHVDAAGDAEHVEVVEGAFGPEVWAEYPGHDVLIHGFSGPRWVCKVTHWGRSLSADDVNDAEQLVAGIIVARGNAPVAPGMPLDMRIVAVAGTAN